MDKQYYEPEYVKHLFDNMSGSYERMNYVTSFGFSIKWRRQFLTVLPKEIPSPEIIDLLTGMGESWRSIKRRYPNAKLSALDFSAEMVKHAHKRNKLKFENSVDLIQSDILKNNLPSNYFDIVTCSFGLKTFDAAQMEMIAYEIRRILKDGGHFTFVEVSKPTNRLLYILYSFYLGRVIPVLGWLFLADPKEYKMLWKYTLAFGNAKTVVPIFERAGLKVKFRSYFFGCATGFWGSK